MCADFLWRPKQKKALDIFPKSQLGGNTQNTGEAANLGKPDCCVSPFKASNEALILIVFSPSFSVKRVKDRTLLRLVSRFFRASCSVFYKRQPDSFPVFVVRFALRSVVIFSLRATFFTRNEVDIVKNCAATTTPFYFRLLFWRRIKR
jgi:hypothetical protein